MYASYRTAEIFQLTRPKFPLQVYNNSVLNTLLEDEACNIQKISSHNASAVCVQDIYSAQSLFRKFDLEH